MIVIKKFKRNCKKN